MGQVDALSNVDTSASVAAKRQDENSFTGKALKELHKLIFIFPHIVCNVLTFIWL